MPHAIMTFVHPVLVIVAKEKRTSVMGTSYRLLIVPTSVVDIIYFDFTEKLFSPRVVALFDFHLSLFGLRLGGT